MVLDHEKENPWKLRVSVIQLQKKSGFFPILCLHVKDEKRFGIRKTIAENPLLSLLQRKEMNCNAVSLLTTSIVLFWPCLYAIQKDIFTNHKTGLHDFQDNTILKMRQPNVKLPVLDSSRKRPVKLASEHSRLLFNRKIASKNDKMPGTSPQILVSQDVDLSKAPSYRFVLVPALPRKDTSREVFSNSDPETGDVTLSFDKNGVQFYDTFIRKIFSGHYKVEKRDRSMRTKMEDTVTGNNCQCNNSSLFTWNYRDNILKIFHPHKNDPQSSIKEPVRDTDSPLLVLKREVSFSTDTLTIPDGESTLVKDAAGGNATDSSLDFPTTEMTPAVTQQPVDEEFLPGITKSRFITVTSTSLMLALLATVVTLCYIRRWRLRRAMDPERQRLIPFKVHIGIYYNQTGPCF